MESVTTRRQLLASAIAFGARRAFAKASQPATPVSFSVPPHACDCHTHIYGDSKKFPLSPTRSYTPEPALPAEMSALHRALHIERVVIVTPSVYGTDNSATLYGMKARGANARGVAVIDEKTPERDLEAMNRAGIRGIRINAASGVAKERFQAAVDRVKRHRWHIQILTSLAAIAALKEQVLASPVPVVFDHFGSAQAALGVEQPGFADLVALVRSGQAYVKISAAYRASQQTPDYADATLLARALIEANPDRILWGSDWPHPNSGAPRPINEVSPFLQIDDGRVLNQLVVWAPDEMIRQKILVDNPARLYGW